MKAIIARKIGMTQMADEQGHINVATLLAADDCVVTQVKDLSKDGYSALQIGSGHKGVLNKPMSGHLKASQKQPRWLREFRYLSDESSELEVGKLLDIEQFSIGDRVQLTAVSKGKGFAGTVKRHNFSRGPVSHGSQNVRKPGSIGSMYPQKIIKGKRMAGRMGHRQLTLKKCEIIYLDLDNHIIGVRGAVPGPRRGIVCLRRD